MYNGKRIIAIIPARSGSKGLRDKNIRNLNGKPMLAYTVEAALKTGFFDRVFVSTDSPEYANIAKNFGAYVPFLRSAENSSDTAGSIGVVREVLCRLEEKFDIFVLLQPTSPMRTAEDIKGAMSLFFEKKADTVVSVCETAHPMFWCNVIGSDLSARDFIKSEYCVPRQNLPKSYMVNGAIYIAKTDLPESFGFYGEKGFLYIMKRNHSLDVDGESDFVLAEYFMNNNMLDSPHS